MSVKPTLLKRVLFRLHWLAGITAGLVLGVVGFTGGLMGMEEPVLALLNARVHAQADGQAALAPDRWIAAARAAYPQQSVRSVAWDGADAAVRVRVAGEGARGFEVAVDPYTAEVLGVPRGSAFFATVEQIHRNLAVGPVGKQIVGASTISMLVFIATGIYLRWPRRARSPSAWLRMNTRANGRGFWWQLHAVVGTWLLVFYFVAAATGLWWSYDVYRNAVNRIAGVSPAPRRPPAGEAKTPVASLDAAWGTFLRQVPEATRASAALAPGADGAIEIRYQTPASPHDRAWNSIKVDPADATVVARETYAELPRGRRFVASLFPLHSGSFWGTPGRLLMALSALLMPLFPLTGLWMWRLRRRNEALRRQHAAALSAPLDVRTA